MMDWKPIESAPRDHEPVLLWAEIWELTWGVQIGYFADGEWQCGEGSVPADDEDAPTHWMPLPEPPSVDGDL